MSRALIFVNSHLDNTGAARAIAQPDDVIIAADGGARIALALGLIPSAILGDFDSLTEAEINVFTDMGVHILRFPPAKDETDLELALTHALRAGHRPIRIIGGYGGRLDQSIANLALLTAPDAIEADVRFDDGVTEAFFITEMGTICGRAGETISLIPWGAPVEGIVTDGLAYPLNRETLRAHRTRGISNQMLGEIATVRLKRGLLLCVHQRKI
jgi:thiamine pyrophosphokinase